MIGEPNEQDLKAASEIAQEVVRRYLPYESPDVGRGRRCVEYIESTVAADRAAVRAEVVARLRAKAHDDFTSSSGAVALELIADEIEAAAGSKTK